MIKNKRLTIPTSLAVDMDAGAPTGITVAHSTEYDLGSTSFSLPFDITADDWTPGTEQWIFLKKQDANNYWGLKLDTGGTLTFIAVVASATILSVTSTSAISAVVGQSVFGCVSATRESAAAAGSAVFIANGAQLGTTVSITAATAASISNTGILYLAGTDAAGSAMIVRAFYPYNRALSVADVTTLRTSGVATADASRSQTAVYTSNFTAGADSFVSLDGGGVTVTGNIDGIDGEDNWCRVSRVSGTGDIRASRPTMFVQGNSYAVTVKIRNETGATANFGVIGLSSTPVSIANNATAVCVFQGTRTQSGTGLIIGRATADNSTTTSGGTGIFYFKEMVQVLNGNTLSLPPTGLDASGTAWTDASGNGNSATLPGSGATKVSAIK